jgi:hypothetical protein
VHYDILWIIAMAYVVWRVLRKKYLKVRSGLAIDGPMVSTRLVFDNSVRYSRRSRIGDERSIYYLLHSVYKSAAGFPHRFSGTWKGTGFAMEIGHCFQNPATSFTNVRYYLNES